MHTRSKSKAILNEKRQIYEVNIDFEEASIEWKKNKKYVGNGTYKYICCANTKAGKKCNKVSISNSEYCKIHLS